MQFLTTLPSLAFFLRACMKTRMQRPGYLPNDLSAGMDSGQHVRTGNAQCGMVRPIYLPFLIVPIIYINIAFLAMVIDGDEDGDSESSQREDPRRTPLVFPP
jgi:hypothetical protein